MLISCNEGQTSVIAQGSGGSKRDLTAKDFLTTLAIMSAVTRRRRKRPTARLLGSSTDDDSEQEPIRVSLTVEGEGEGKETEQCESDMAPRAEAEEDEDEAEDDEENAEVSVASPGKEKPGKPCEEEAHSVILSEEEDQRSETKGRSWRGDDARSIVSGYSTLSTLGRSLASEGRGDDADDEHSELVSETDNESGFASRSLTQERPEKRTPPPSNMYTSAEPPAPRSFLYTHYKASLPTPIPAPAPAPTSMPVSPSAPCKHPTPELVERGTESAARSSTPSTSSSTASQRLQNRPSFNSHRLIQCDTLARRRLKTEKAKARSLDLLEVHSASLSEEEPQSNKGRTRTSLLDSSTSHSPKLTPSSSHLLASPSTLGSTSGAANQASLAEQVRARLLGSAEDIRSVGLRKPLSPETCRRRRAWRRHTVVVSPTDSSQKSSQVSIAVNNNKPPPPPPKPSFLIRRLGEKPILVPQRSSADASSLCRAPPTSQFHECL